MGKIVSLVAIVVLWKPYYLFTSGFKVPVMTFWKGVLRNYAISAFAIGLSVYIVTFIPIDPYHSLWNWLCYAAVCMSIFLCLQLGSTLLVAKGAKDSLNRIKNIRKR
jgi:hypothetical protein